MIIFYSPRFKKRYKKLPKYIKELSIRKTDLFIREPFSPQLKTHKLLGELDGYWAFSVSYSYRVVFKFLDNNTAYFVSIGTHAIYE